MHWCMDETLAVLAMIPFIGYFFRKLHVWWHKHFHHPCHEEGCKSEHVYHTEEAPAPLMESSWDQICEEDLEERVGTELLNDLFFSILNKDDLIGATREEFTWYINDAQEVRVEVRGRAFTYDYTSALGWEEVLH